MVDLSSSTLCYILEMVGCCYSGDIDYLDRLQADYGICLEDAMSNHDFGHVLKSYIDGRSNTTPLNYLIHKVLMEFALQACEKYGADYGKFDIRVNATDSHIYYNGEEFRDAEGFEVLMEGSYDYYTYEGEEENGNGGVALYECKEVYQTTEEAEKAAREYLNATRKVVEFKDVEQTFVVDVHYSGFRTYEVKATSLEEAKEKARNGEYEKEIDGGENVDYVSTEDED